MTKDEINKYFTAKAQADKIAKEEELLNKEGGPGADDVSSRRAAPEGSSTHVEIDELDDDMNLGDADEQFLKDTED